jgi:hypothetical protein
MVNLQQLFASRHPGGIPLVAVCRQVAPVLTHRYQQLFEPPFRHSLVICHW